MNGSVRDDILNTVSEMGSAASVVTVIRTVSTRQPPAIVREVYWQLVADNQVTRSADGRLALNDGYVVRNTGCRVCGCITYRHEEPGSGYLPGCACGHLDIAHENMD